MAQVELILLQRVEKLGQMGDRVRVKPGYARNFLLPQKRAIRANKANLEQFEANRAGFTARSPAVTLLMPRPRTACPSIAPRSFWSTRSRLSA